MQQTNWQTNWLNWQSDNCMEASARIHSTETVLFHELNKNIENEAQTL